MNSVAEYYKKFMVKPEYKDGDRIAYASRVFDEKEMMNLADSMLEFWLTSETYGVSRYSPSCLSNWSV